MDKFVARQPIFDRKMNVFAYELLYRKTSNNFFEGDDDESATAEVIQNTFLVMNLEELTGGKKAFINFPLEMLLHEIPLMLPADQLVVEVLERVPVSDALVNICRKLRAKGYLIALDDFVFSPAYEPLLAVTDIIKIEFPALEISEQIRLIKKYPQIRFLAERVENREEFLKAAEMGYTYFQGYFFSKPVMVSGKEIGAIHPVLLQVMSMLLARTPDFKKIADVIKKDMGLSYKLLRLANSPYFLSRSPVADIKQAIVLLGLEEMKKWIYIMMLSEKEDGENKELISNCLIRARFMELVAEQSFPSRNPIDFFLTGLFSEIHIILQGEMEKIVNQIPLHKDVKGALLGEPNEITAILQKAKDLETGNWADQEPWYPQYLEALRWQKHQ